METSRQKLLKQLPKVDRILSVIRTENLHLPREFILRVIRTEIDQTRTQILSGIYDGHSKELDLTASIIQSVKQQCIARQIGTMPRVINATGIVLHTGLGRAPLSPRAQEALNRVSDGYSSLEFDLESGKRGQRNDHIEDLLCALTDAEAGLMVNNNAAAVLLAINTLADKKEAIISRGQLVEVGGSFRIPEVMAKSGAKMVEIGTTNRTHLKDYTNAISEKSGVIVIAHTSNYRVEGFTTMPSLEEIVELGHKNDLPVLYDLGSGAFYELERYNLPHEPVVQEVIKAGVDVVTFSGDKLVGGPQSGLIVGKKKYVQPIKSNPLTRALRCDKLIYAAMEATLQSYITPDKLPDENLTYNLLTRSLEDLKHLGEKLITGLKPVTLSTLDLELTKADTQAGSGSLPTEDIPSMALVLKSEQWSADKTMHWMRARKTPVIGYIESDQCYFNLRTVFDRDASTLIQAFNELAQEIAAE